MKTSFKTRKLLSKITKDSLVTARGMLQFSWRQIIAFDNETKISCFVGVVYYSDIIYPKTSYFYIV